MSGLSSIEQQVLDAVRAVNDEKAGEGAQAGFAEIVAACKGSTPAEIQRALTRLRGERFVCAQTLYGVGGRVEEEA